MSRGRRKLASDDGWAEHGGYMAAKKRKLDEQFREDAPKQIHREGSSSKIFEGVKIYINGYTVPSSDELKRLMMLHGGQHQYYYSKTTVTHMIASALPHGKIRELKGERVVKPEWILDCIKAGKLLSCTPYLLYSQRTQAQPGLPFGRAVKGEQTSQGGSQESKWKEAISIQASASGDSANRTSDVKGNVANQNADLEPPVQSVESLECEQEQGNLTSAETLAIKIPVQTDLESGKKTSEVKNKEHSPCQSLKFKEQKSPAKAGEANFVSEFYSNSRLHHISTWGAEYKALVKKLQSEGDTSFPGREKLRKLGSETGMVGEVKGTKKLVVCETSRVIMHVDMDCFFVSVGLLSRPELNGKPVAVTHSKGRGAQTDRTNTDPVYEREYYNHFRKEKSLKGKTPHGRFDITEELQSSKDSGALEIAAKPDIGKSSEEFNSMAEIASCSYEARKAGIKNGMFMGTAKKLCPELKTIPYDFDKYKEVSQILYETVASYTHDIEAVSCDEMLVDIGDVLQDTRVTSLQFSEVLREEVYQKTGCRASVGLASNILLARMATRVAKPNGQFHLAPEKVTEFITTQLVKDLPGVGWSLGHRLSTMGVKTCADLQEYDQRNLQKEFGPKTGQSLYQYCRGIDDRPIRVDQERKSVSAEINYGIRFTEDSEADKFISELSEEVQKRLANVNLKGKTITLKLKVRKAGAPVETAKFMGHGVCDNLAKSTTLVMPTDQVQVIRRESLALLKQMKIPACELRGMGIQIHRLSSNKPGGQATQTRSVLDFMKNIPKPSMSTEPKPSIPQEPVTNNSNAPSMGQEEDRESFMTPSPRSKHGIKALFKKSSVSSSASASMATSGASSTSSATTATREDEDLYLPSPSQVDPSVLAALPENLRDQIMKGYAARNQKIPDRNTVAQEPSIPSEWDVSVLQALPAEVVKDLLLTELEEKAQTVKQLSEVNPPTMKQKTVVRWTDDPGAGPSGVSVKNESNIQTKNGSIEALPSFSQIDPSFLEALPSELQAELKSAYQEKANQLKHTDSSKQKSSPLKLKSPKKGTKKKVSPGKAQRGPGRPKKTSPQKQKTDWKIKQRNIQNMFMGTSSVVGSHHGNNMADSHDTNNMANSHHGNKDTCLGDGQERGKGDEGSCSWVETVANTKEKEENSTQEDKAMFAGKKIHLCGRVELQDVKTLLKEWVESCTNPETEDVQQFVEYLSDLIDDKNLEMVDLLLKYIKRLVNLSERKPWLDGYDIIVNQVQGFIKAVYGSRLKIT